LRRAAAPIGSTPSPSDRDFCGAIGAFSSFRF
jgi:hypothetical protein